MTVTKLIVSHFLFIRYIIADVLFLLNKKKMASLIKLFQSCHCFIFFL